MFVSVKKIFALLLLILGITVQLRAEQAVVRKETGLLDTPESKGVILDVLTAGMSVEVINVQGDWARVSLPATSEMGWAMKKDIMLESEKASAGLPVSVKDLSVSEMDKLHNRVKVIGQSLEEMETRVDGLVDGMEAKGYKADSPPKIPAQAQMPGQPPPGAPSQMQLYNVPPVMGGILEMNAHYRWRNQFYMGKYIRGGQDFYGLSLSRFLDRFSRLQLDGDCHYAVGDNRGKRDDFIEWSAGLIYNLWPERYRIYPYLAGHFGRRHLLASPVTYNLVSPGLGINAELSGIFSLSAGVDQVFLLRSGEHRDDLRVSFHCGFSY